MKVTSKRIEYCKTCGRLCARLRRGNNIVSACCARFMATSDDWDEMVSKDGYEAPNK